MKAFLHLSAIIAILMVGTLGGVFLLVSGWTIFLAPFWIAAAIRMGAYVIDRMDPTL